MSMPDKKGFFPQHSNETVLAQRSLGNAGLGGLAILADALGNKQVSEQLKENFNVETLKRSFEHGSLESSTNITELQQEISKTTEPTAQKSSSPTGLFGPDAPSMPGPDKGNNFER